jgi:hypothetical protein
MIRQGLEENKLLLLVKREIEGQQDKDLGLSSLSPTTMSKSISMANNLKAL